MNSEGFLSSAHSEGFPNSVHSEANCFYVQSALKFKENGARNINGVFRAYNSGYIYIFGESLFNHLYTRDEITQHIGEIQAYARMNHLHLSGFLIIGIRGRTDVAYERLKLSLRKVSSASCSIKITAKVRDAEPKHSLTLEEKVALVMQYYEENERLPDVDVVYNDFKLGKWLDSVHSQHVLYQSIVKSSIGDEADEDDESSEGFGADTTSVDSEIEME